MQGGICTIRLSKGLRPQAAQALSTSTPHVCTLLMHAQNMKGDIQMNPRQMQQSLAARL